MSSMLNRRKHFEELCERTSEDRISSLPSSLIGHILSFLPTKDAVATSVLSTRWKELWTLITHLYFDDYLLRSPKKKKQDIDALRNTFKEFVYRVLLLGRFSCIETFRLHCVECYDALAVNSWLVSVLTCKVQELDIRVPQMHSSLLPSNLFTCTTPVKLKLGSYIYMNVPRLVLLPCVKFVELAGVYFPDDDSITRFLNGCPVLDTLKMKRCVGPRVRVVKICNPLLRSLDLTFLFWGHEFWVGMLGDDGRTTLRIMLNTPFLSDLFIEDFVPEGYVVENLHELTSAHIHIPLSGGTVVISSPDFPHDDAISDLLKGISGVQKLHFCTEDNDRQHDLPMFGNMDELVYVVNHNDKFETLLNLLERSPRLRSLRTDFCYCEVCVGLQLFCQNQDFFWSNELQYLTCYMFNVLKSPAIYYPTSEMMLPVLGFFGEAYHPPELELPQQVPDCLLFQLKIIKIVNFQGFRDEVKLVGYFLKNARVLEKLIISCKSRFLEQYLMMHEDLRFLPRLCQIEFEQSYISK